MSGEELEGQRRELSGLEIAHCDLCGQAMPVAQLGEIESQSRLAEHDHTPMVCPTCWDGIHRGEVDVESLLADEDEYIDEDRP